MARKTPTPQKPVPVFLGFAVKRRGPDGRIKIRPRWLRIGLSLLALALATYYAGVWAVYIWYKEIKDPPYATVDFGSVVVLPIRIDEHRREFGQYNIEQAERLIAEGEWRDAIQNLSVGVRRNPSSHRGRRLMAEFQIARGNYERAVANLREGLQYEGYNEEYIHLLYRLMILTLQRDQEAQELAQQQLVDVNPAQATRKEQIIAFYAALAHQFRGQFDVAEEYIRDYNLTGVIDGVILQANIAWERGQSRRAIEILESNVDRWGNRGNNSIYRDLIRYLRELGEYSRARRYAVQWMTEQSLDYRPRVQFLYVLENSDQEERLEREIEDMLRRFGNEEQALMGLANFAANTARPRLALRTYERALEQGFPISGFALLYIESLVVAERYVDAIQFADQLLDEGPEWLESLRGQFYGLRAVARYGVGAENEADQDIQLLLNADRVQPRLLLSTALRFREMGAIRRARLLLLRAYEADPINQPILGNLIEVELDLGNTDNLADLLEALIQTRRPTLRVVQEAFEELNSDRFIFAPNREAILERIQTHIEARLSQQRADEPV